MSPRVAQLNAKQIIAALKRAGFEEDHQKGSHVYLYHPEKKLTTTIPVHPGDMKRPLLKKIIKQADLSEDMFRKLL